jgi:hypothetical protein
MVTPESRKQMDAAIEAILADPEAFRKKLEAEARAENPSMTQEQLDAAWEQVAHQFGI